MTAQPQQQLEKVGLVGLGLVGKALHRRLQNACIPCVGFDLSQPAIQAFKSEGGECASTLKELASKTTTLLLAVYDTEDVKNVIAQSQLQAAECTVKVIVDCSTGDPLKLALIADELNKMAIALIEAPLSGSSQQIAAGEATMLLGGDAKAIQEAKTLLAAISEKRHHIGSAGMGAKAKLASNLILGLNRAALAEGLVFAETLGLDAQAFLNVVLNSPAKSDAALVKGPQMIANDFAPRSRIRQHLKDLDIMLTHAQAAGQTLPFTETHAKLLRAAVAQGDGDLDNAAIIAQIRKK